MDSAAHSGANSPMDYMDDGIFELRILAFVYQKLYFWFLLFGVPFGAAKCFLSGLLVYADESMPE